MHINNVLIYNFRNIEKLSLELNNGINIFYGNNAQGKTSFLEAIYICGTGRSHRTNYDRELIKFNESDAHIKLDVSDEFSDFKIDLHMNINKKKGIAIDSVPLKKLGELFGHLLLVIFSPEDLELVKGSPMIRRRYIDMELCQISSIYYYKLQQYYKVLKQRNNLLKSIVKNKDLIDSLDVWDYQLIEYGIDIVKLRMEFIENIQLLAGNIYRDITNGNEELKILYKPSVNENNYESKLLKNRDRDIILGSTNIGIHKDEMMFYVNGFDLRSYGSQGQQRSCALSMKLAEVELIKQVKNRTPILLLDDILSELDKNRQEFVLQKIDKIQTIITTTGSYDIISQRLKNSFVFYVENGNITFEN